VLCLFICILQVAHILDIMVPEIVENLADYILRSVINLQFLFYLEILQKVFELGMLPECLEGFVHQIKFSSSPE